MSRNYKKNMWKRGGIHVAAPLDPALAALSFSRDPKMDEKSQVLQAVLNSINI